MTSFCRNKASIPAVKQLTDDDCMEHVMRVTGALDVLFYEIGHNYDYIKLGILKIDLFICEDL